MKIKQLLRNNLTVCVDIIRLSLEYNPAFYYSYSSKKNRKSSKESLKQRASSEPNVAAVSEENTKTSNTIKSDKQTFVSNQSPLTNTPLYVLIFSVD